MAENPYQPHDSPLLAMTAPRPRLPLGRRVVSVALITLGATFTPALLASPLVFCIWLFDPTGHGEPLLRISAVFLAEGIVAVAMIWGGIRLRRFPESAATLATQAAHNR
ncbi:MAG: hypothetical protein AB7U73_07005 [Pirellulales bacterium]